jgi:hypothetical protein
MEQLARRLDPIAAGQADCPKRDCQAALDALHAWHAAIARLPSAAASHLRDAATACRECGGSCEIRQIIEASLSEYETRSRQGDSAPAGRTAGAARTLAAWE